MNTLILGVGNLLLQDEGVGIHVIHALEKETLPSDIHLLDGGTGGFHLIGWIENYDRIIMVDATLDNHPPGTIRLITPRYSSDFPPLMSAHEIGLKDMIEVMQLSAGKLPEIQLLVVSVVNISRIGMKLSPPVEAAVPVIVSKIKALIRQINT